MIRKCVSGLRILVFSLVFFLRSSEGFSTTIVPFENLGQLSITVPHVIVGRVVENFEYAENGQIHYRTRFIVDEVVKGDLVPGGALITQKWEIRSGDYYRVMFGDLDFDKGGKYLLFLTPRGDDLYHPVCFSYYVFKEVFIDQKAIWEPTSKEHEFHLTPNKNVEPLFYYDRDALIEHLGDVSQGLVRWDADKVKTHVPLVEKNDHTKRQSPGHCSFLTSGSTRFRWIDFPEQPVVVHYASGGDQDCSNGLNYVQQSISNLNQAYEGINLVDGGVFTGYNPECGSGVQGSNYISYIQSQWSGTRHTLVQFSDPCNAIPNLSNCSGTLAVGGLYGLGSHTYDGETWLTGAYGYVVVNNGVGQCMCSMASYGSMMTHELSHTLGIGHISSSSGTANMNPACCSEITDLDLACVNYTYESSVVLPVELLSFQADAREVYNEIWWETASETNVERFRIERTRDEGLANFESVEDFFPQLSSESPRSYMSIDRFPWPKTYYRLKVIDLDGSVQYSKLVAVQRKVVQKSKIYPTLTEDKFFVILGDKSTGELVHLSMISLSGRKVLQNRLSSNVSQLSIGHLPSGLYMVVLTYDDRTETLRLTKS